MVSMIEVPVGEWIFYYSYPHYNIDRKDYFKFRPFFEEVSKMTSPVGAEIGVFEGYNSLGVCEFCKPKKLYLIDPYVKYSEIVEGMFNILTQNVWEKIFNRAKQLLESKPVEFIRKTSIEGAKDVPDGLDFVYIDGDHRKEAVLKDIETWYPKVRSGGLFGGHDALEPEVQQAVSQWIFGNKQYTSHNYKWNDWWITKQ